jgi:2,4-dienoyl-CoA reductase-like NADH-dependent reductase (Old Yellow Enzyme family)
MVEKLFTPLAIGDLVLPNRIVMAPLTRNRALPDGDVPHALNTEYYAQRVSAGLIVSETTQIPKARATSRTPGIHSAEEVEGWRLVTNAVHAKGGPDLIAFGRLFLANPDLVARLEKNAPLNEPDIRCSKSLRPDAPLGHFSATNKARHPGRNG